MSPGGIVRLNLDLGHIVSSFIMFEIQAPAGAVLGLACLEGPLNDPTSNIDVCAGTRYIAHGEDDRFQVFDSNGFRHVYILVHGVQGSFVMLMFFQRQMVSGVTAGAIKG